MEDGTYLDTFGEQSESGTWSEIDGKISFDLQGGEAPARCYAIGATDADGSFTATPEEAIRVRAESSTRARPLRFARTPQALGKDPALVAGSVEFAPARAALAQVADHTRLDPPAWLRAFRSVGADFRQLLASHDRAALGIEQPRDDPAAVAVRIFDQTPAPASPVPLTGSPCRR